MYVCMYLNYRPVYIIILDFYTLKNIFLTSAVSLFSKELTSLFQSKNHKTFTAFEHL